MKLIRSWLYLAITVVCLCAPFPLFAESVATLPAPTGYVNDFAGVLSAPVQQQVEALCTAVDRQAHAQIAVVTIKTIDNDESVEEFATQLEDKWKVGAKGTDRGVLMLFVMNPRHGRIEVGYGLEGILNDAKVGDIGRAMVPAAAQNDYNTAIPLGVQQISNVIAADAGVTITPIVYTYHRQVEDAPATMSPGGAIVTGIIVLVVLFLLIRGGGGPLLWMLLGNILGGGFGGGGGRRGGGGFGGGGDNDGGGGFGGFGGGSSGGGGASGDF